VTVRLGEEVQAVLRRGEGELTPAANTFGAGSSHAQRKAFCGSDQYKTLLPLPVPSLAQQRLD
jgi:hypothetical protein